MRYNTLKRVALRLLISSLGIIVCSCAAEAPESSINKASKLAPDRWSATKQAQAGVDENWVARFRDNKLNALVKEALKQNQDIRIAAERVHRASEAARVSNASSKPQINLNANGSRQETIFVGFPFGGSFLSNAFGVDMTVDWEPDVWGRARAGKSAALAEWQAGGADYRAAKASLVGQICKAWFILAEASEQVSLAKEALAIRKKTETAVRERFESSLSEEGGSAAQLRIAQTDVATAQAEQSRRQGDLELARRQLELLAGRYPAGKISGRARLPRIPSRPPSGLPSELLLRRPDILAAERRYSGSIKRVKEARLAVFPSFSLTGSVGTTTDSLEDILNSDFGVWSIGSSIVQPVINGGRVRAENRRRKSNQREALATLHKTVLNAFGEVEQSLAAERWLANREREMSKALKLAKEAAASADSDFRDGNGDLLTLYTAQTRRIEIASQYSTLRQARLSNRVDLHLALGGSFSVKP